MEVIKGYIEDNALVIALNGHIDSSNAADVEKEINQLRDENTFENVYLDAENLEYISSAGLRIILRLRKNYSELKIMNVHPDVYEILDMTGFTEMIDVEKAYRRLSVDGCEEIGRGANGIVYRLDPDTIIKVYFNSDALADVHRERELARKAFILGIPTAIPYDVVRVGDTYGSVFELLNATSLSSLIARHPEQIDTYVSEYVELLKKIHSTRVKEGDMPDMKITAQDWVDFLKDYLPEDQSEKLCGMVAAIPKDDHMLHGDFHTKNVMVQNGEVLLIDMDTLSVGNPVFELASMYMGFVGFAEEDHQVSIDFLGIPYETAVTFWKKSLALYLGTEDEETNRIAEEKAMVIGYARLLRRTIRRNGLNTPDGQSRIALCKRHLEELLARIDTLAI